jgi:hypothetical protein
MKALAIILPKAQLIPRGGPKQAGFRNPRVLFIACRTLAGTFVPTGKLG